MCVIRKNLAGVQLSMEEALVHIEAEADLERITKLALHRFKKSRLKFKFKQKKMLVLGHLFQDRAFFLTLQRYLPLYN